MSNIHISQKHGVNPAVQVCFYCRKAIGVALLGRLHADKVKAMFGKEFAEHHLKHNDPQDTEAPREIVLSLEPCEGCTVFYPNAKEGVFLIEATPAEAPTGNFVVMRDEAIRRIFSPPDLVADILKRRMALISREAWRELGLDDAVEVGMPPAVEPNN